MNNIPFTCIHRDTHTQHSLKGWRWCSLTCRQTPNRHGGRCVVILWCMLTYEVWLVNSGCQHEWLINKKKTLEWPMLSWGGGLMFNITSMYYFNSVLLLFYTWFVWPPSNLWTTYHILWRKKKNTVYLLIDLLFMRTLLDRVFDFLSKL